MSTELTTGVSELDAAANQAPAAPGVVTHDARHRMQRMLFLATGVGALVFGGLLATGGGGILAQMSQLAPWYAWGSVAIVLLLPASFIVLTFVVPIRVMYALAATASIGFVVVELLWVPAMNDEVLLNDASPWLQGVTALAATITAARWQSRWVWPYALATGPIVAINQMFARDGSPVDAVLAGLGGMLFSLILMGVAMAVVKAADTQDQVAAQARAQASLEAAKATRDREQTRINAIVHDDVMSVLLTAGKNGPAPGLAEQAERALAAIAAITQEDSGRSSYSPAEFTAVLRATVNDIVSDVNFTNAVLNSEPLPRIVVAATTEALAEALRNSSRHAATGDAPVAREVHVDITDGGVSVRVSDSGRGFTPRAVGPRRLGIRVSIIDRMRSIDGGDAAVESKPGAGTTVSLTWRRP